MKTKTLLLTVALGLSLGVSAQFNGNKLKQYDGQFEIVLYDLPVNGTPYLDELYKKGTITVDNPQGTLKEERLMRYNAFTGDIEYLAGNQEEPRRLLKRENIEVVLNGFTFEVHPYKVNGEINRGYFVPLNPGAKLTLYKRPIKNYRKPDLPDHGYEPLDYPEYFDASEFFLHREGETGMTPITLNKRSLLKAMADQRNAVEQFMKQYRINPKDPEEAIKVLAYYNNLEAIN